MSLLSNAIGWANFQINGGPARMAWVCGGVAILLPLLIFGSARANPDAVQASLRSWFTVILVLQAGLLLIGLPSRVHAAIRRDRTQRLVESHRLMPLPASHAIAGYLIGPNLLLLGCVGVLFATGLTLTMLIGQDWRGWIVLHAAGIALSVSFCCVVAFTSQCLPKLNPALLFVIFGPMFGAVSVALLPAVRVLYAPFFADFDAIRRGTIEPPLIVAVAGQALLAAIFFVAAGRRYRRDDVPALGVGLGLVLLATWVGLTLIGLRVDDGSRSTFDFDSQVVATAYVVSLSLSLLLATGPVASAALGMVRWRERRAIDPHCDTPRPVRVSVVTALVLALLAALLLGAPREIVVVPTQMESVGNTIQVAEGTGIYAAPGVEHLALTFGVIACFIVTVALLAWAAGRRRMSTIAVLAIWIGLTWALPPIPDGIRAMALASRGEPAGFPGPLGTLSPPFALGAIWIGDLRAARIGLIVQAALVPALLAGLAILHRRRGNPEVPTPVANG